MRKFSLGIVLALGSILATAQIGKKPAVISKEKLKKALSTPILVESVDRKGNELNIPYKKFKMANGLTIIVHEDHSDPVVYVDVTYHVGSNREQQGRSGFAHFFEHMMFQGSKHVADEEHFKIVTEAGGELNGTTNTDRTNYFQVVPSNQLELMLWLESDRMGFLLDSVNQKKFEVQRATVKNERGQRYDNAPYGLVREKVGEALYPKGHPYSWSTIGYIEDLNRVDVEDLKRFYLRWYGPNNATLTIAGDVKTEEAIKLAEKYFGPIPMGPAVNALPPMPANLPETRYISYEDNIKFPLLNMVWPTVPDYHKDGYALEALAYMVAGGKSSPFHLKLEKTQKAVSANAFQFGQEIAGTFQVMARAPMNTSLADLEKEINIVFKEWEEKGISDEELIRYKNEVESSIYDGLTTVRGKGARLAAYQTYRQNPNSIGYEMEMVRKLTKEDIIRVYNTYIKGKNAVILSCVPKGKSDLRAKEDNWKMYERTVEKESDEYKNLTYKPLKETFDRFKKPTSGENPSIKAPAYWTETLPNSIKIHGTQYNEVPKVEIVISINAGHRYNTPDKAGLAMLTADLLNESTTDRSAEEISDILKTLGSKIDVSANANEVTITVHSLEKNLDKTLGILEDILFHPKFDQTEFDKAKRDLNDIITQQNTQATAMADQAFNAVLYGSNHIMSIPQTGTAETLKNISVGDVRSFYDKFYVPSVTRIAIVGNLTKEQALSKFAFLNKWKNNKVVKPSEPTPPSVEKTKIYFVDKKGAPQSEIRIGYLSLPFDALGDYYKCGIMNFPLSGSFNSRVNLNLREKKGFTYGAKGGFRGTYFDGIFAMSAGVKASATDSSVIEFMSELKNYAENGITDAELEFTKHSISHTEALRFEAPQQKAGFLKRLQDYNLDGDFIIKQEEILEKISKAEINALAKKYLPYNKVAIVIVGDKEKQLEKVKALGYDVVEIDVNGKSVGK